MELSTKDCSILAMFAMAGGTKLLRLRSRRYYRFLGMIDSEPARQVAERICAIRQSKVGRKSYKNDPVQKGALGLLQWAKENRE